MQNNLTSGNESGNRRLNRMTHTILGLGGLTVGFVTFFVGAAELSGSVRSVVFIVAIAGFLLLCLLSYLRVDRGIVADRLRPVEATQEKQDAETDERLIALDEAHQFFGSSLNSADMFRLVSSRVREIFPFASSVLFIPDEAAAKLKAMQTDGRNSESMEALEFAVDEGLAGRAFASKEIEIDAGLTLDINTIGPERLKSFRSAVAIPLVRDGTAFGVFQLFTDEAVTSSEDDLKLLEAIREHVSPLLRGAMAFDESVSSALTDVLTGLPNERAFNMILENQLAESLRFRDERPLTILSIDIRDFAEVNAMLGHNVGDRMLQFAGKTIGESLRKMDFLARVMNDEFGVILPTASEKTAAEVIERVRESFARVEFEINSDEGVSISLNIGWATFWKDGETVEQLIRSAQLRKRQAKSEASSGVLWFPKEYVN